MFRFRAMDRANGIPPSPPPNFVPEKGKGKKVKANGYAETGMPQGGGPGPKGSGPSVKAVDPGAVFPCLYKFTYIWTSNGRGFWAYITYVGRRSLSGWRFMRGRWQYFGMDLRNVDEFYCN